MPTPTTSDLPTPKSWDEFEDIVWKIYRREWQDSHAQRYGRSGQCQNGVDIYGQQNGSGRYIAVQCKRYKDGKLNCKKIEEEISKAESFSSVISEYVIATTESRDTKIQDCIRRLNTRREPEGKFKVYVVFWEDLCDKLTTLSNQDLFKDCYPEWGRIFKAPDLNIDWYQISQFRSGEQQRLTTNFLTRNEEITYHFEQVYVPLGLEERKKIPRRRDDIAPEEGSKLYRETEITQTFEHEQFLDQVFRQKQSPKSQGRRIAIIGKPGAGKTTRLQQIAQWVTKKLKQTVIWVSLSALEGQTLEEYLLKTWLKNRLQVANVSPEQENAFVEWFKDSQIWLLLDGADEMSSGTHASSLQAIAYQITGWVGQARIVLTCRQNLWDSYAHDVETFDSYRTLEFSYPTQVEQFIENWFAPSSAEEATRGQRLCVALHERGRERIQDLVRNPLLLTLLCLDWHVREGKLPETRAALYKQFTRDFYDWKQEEFSTTHQQREQLNAKLRELALEAIETETNRFCLRQEFVCQFMGEPEDKDSLFYLALKLGLLNKVGVDANNRRESVYAFLHPTFEEYFAALEIVRQFKKNRLSFEQVRDETFWQHWQDEVWYEVLLLICSLIDAKSAGELVKFLLETYLKDRETYQYNVFSDEENEAEELLDEEYEYGGDSCDVYAYFDLQKVGANKLIFAADCFSQIRKTFEDKEVLEELLLNTLIELDSDTEDFLGKVQLTSERELDFYIQNKMFLVKTIAKYWKDHQKAYRWLKHEAESGLFREYQQLAADQLEQWEQSK